MSEPGAMIHIVSADHRAHEFLKQVVFLVGAPGRGQAGDAVRSEFILYCGEPPGCEVQRLIPGCFPEFAVFLNERGFEPLVVTDEFIAVWPFYTETPPIHPVIGLRLYTDDPVLQHIEFKLTPAAAIAASRFYPLAEPGPSLVPA